MYLLFIFLLLLGCDNLHNTVKYPIEKELSAIRTENELRRKDAQEDNRKRLKEAEQKAYEAIEKYEQGLAPLPYVDDTGKNDYIVGGEPYVVYCRIIRRYREQIKRDELKKAREKAREEGRKEGIERYNKSKE